MTTSREVQQLVASLISSKLQPAESAIITASRIQLPPHSHGRLSPSQIEMYWRCPKQYWYRYGEGIKLPPGVAMVEGSSHHQAFADNNEYKKKTGKDRSIKWLCSRFADDFDEKQKEIPKKQWKVEGQSKDGVIKRSKLIQEMYLKRIAPHTSPAEYEKEVEYKIGDVVVLGVIDVAGVLKPDGRSEGLKEKFIYNDTEILKRPLTGAWDYKIVGKKKSLKEASNSIALSHYGWATIDLIGGVDLKKNLPSVGFISFTKTKVPGCHVQIVPITAERIKWYRKQVLSVADAISRGSFPVRNSSGWECSAKFCGYYSRCRGKVWKG